jgi:hypothetical protein
VLGVGFLLMYIVFGALLAAMVGAPQA